jgi:hypothetical protein
MRALIIVLLASTAYADSSVTAGEAFEPSKCTMEQGPLRKDWNAADIKKLEPKGTHLYQAAGKKHLLFSSGYFDKPAKSVIVERNSGKTVLTLDKVSRSALVEDASGALLGLLALRDVGDAPTHLMLHKPDGKEAWSMQPLVDRNSDSATTLVAGDLLIVAFFHRIATGSSLVAFDLKTGVKKWQAEVQQLNVGHSKYWNDVSLELRGATVVMRGFEAAGCYLQVFDVATGKRLSAAMPKTGWN